jgi:hypothetical protein
LAERLNYWRLLLPIEFRSGIQLSAREEEDKYPHHVNDAVDRAFLTLSKFKPSQGIQKHYSFLMIV